MQKMGGDNTESETIDLETPNFSEAEALFKQFLKGNPDDKLGIESYCRFLERHKKKPAAAQSYFSAYVERAASDVERLMAFAEFLHSSLNKHEDAKKAYQRSCVVFICLVLSCLVLSCRVLSCLVLLSCVVLCSLVLFWLMLSFFVLCYLVLGPWHWNHLTPVSSAQVLNFCSVLGTKKIDRRRWIASEKPLPSIPIMTMCVT
jgi:hypothetical protein